MVKQFPQVVNLLVAVNQRVVVGADDVRDWAVDFVHVLLDSGLAEFAKVDIPTVSLVFHIIVVLLPHQQLPIRLPNKLPHITANLFNLIPDNLVHHRTGHIGPYPILQGSYNLSEHLNLIKLFVFEVDLVNALGQQLVQNNRRTDRVQGWLLDKRLLVVRLLYL